MAPTVPDQLSFDDRLLAETLRLYEDEGRRPIDDPLANLHAQSAEGDLEKKIAVRAKAAQIAEKLRDSLRAVRASISWSVFIGAAAAAILGAATARATLGTAADGVVNFYWVLGGVLGVQSFALLAWIMVMIATGIASLRSGGLGRYPAGPSSVVSLGAAVVAAGQWLAKRFAREGHQHAAIAATVRVNSAGALGRWTFSSITHLLWMFFNIGCIGLIFYLLATRHYTFVWETTILSPDRYVTLTRGIAALPDRCGIITPDREQIRNSQSPPPVDATAPAEEASEAWAGLLVGSIVLYGFGPRLLLLGFAMGRRRTERSRYQLDVSLPGFAQLEHLLMPRTAAIGKLHEDADTTQGELAPPSEEQRASRPVSDANVVLGLEIERPAAGWPPPIHGVSWEDWGIIEGGDEQRAALKRLETADAEPRSLVIVCALTTTPDRGIERFVAQAKRRMVQPVLMLLTAGQALRARGSRAEDVAQRVADWRKLAGRAGVEKRFLLEVDLEHLTEASRRRIHEAVASGASQSAKGARRIEDAFELIAQQAAQWEGVPGPPDPASQAELHRKIGALYEADRSRWPSIWGPDALKGDVMGQLRTGAQRVQSLLPDRLRRSPKWLAAGALSGALGCIAAATLVSPVAIGALPMWSAIGAGIAAIWQPARSDKGSAPENVQPPVLGDAVHAAALFAMLLELQGRDEESITRLIDDAVGPNVDREIATSNEARQWLDETRHRLDLSMTRSTST